MICLQYKFDMLTDLIRANIDILFISETKIDETFPSSQFSILGFSTPYRLDRTGSALRIKSLRYNNNKEALPVGTDCPIGF